MNEKVFQLLMRVQADFIMLQKTLQTATLLYDEWCKNPELMKDESIPRSAYFWMPKVLAIYPDMISNLYPKAIREVLKVTLLPDDEMQKHLDANPNLSEEEKIEIMKSLCHK